MEIHNDTTSTAPVQFVVFEAYGNTPIFEREFQLGVGERIRIEPIEVLDAAYRVRTEVGERSREAELRPDENSFFRFVILDETIAFQRVSP